MKEIEMELIDFICDNSHMYEEFSRDEIYEAYQKYKKKKYIQPKSFNGRGSNIPEGFGDNGFIK